MTSLLTAQHGIFRRDQAAQLGIHAPHGEPAASRVLPSIYSVIPPPLSWAARLSAAVLYGGQDAALEARSAAEVYLWLPADVRHAVELMLPHDRKRRSRDFVSARRTRLPLWTRVRGFPVTEPARTIIALGRSLPPRELIAVTATAVQRRDLRLSDLIALAEAHPNVPGARAALAAAATLSGGEESLPEHDLTALLTTTWLPKPLHQVDVFDGHELITTADHFWMHPFVAGYYDGRPHLSTVAQDGDAMRTLRIRGLGIEPVRVTAAGMRNPRFVVEAFVQAFRTATAANLPPSPRLQLRHRGTWIWGPNVTGR